MIKSISKSKSNNNTNQKIINKYNQVKQVYKSPIIPQFIIIITFLPATIIITYLFKTNNLLLIFVKINIYIYIYIYISFSILQKSLESQNFTIIVKIQNITGK